MKKMRKFLVGVVALSLAASCLFGITGCESKKAKIKKEKAKLEAEEDEDEGNEEDDEDELKPLMPAIAKNPGEELNIENLGGYWVDELGTYMYIYENEDRYFLNEYDGRCYEITDFEDGYIDLYEYEDYSVSAAREINNNFPVPYDFRIPASLENGKLQFGNLELYRSDSNEGLMKLQGFVAGINLDEFYFENNYMRSAYDFNTLEDIGLQFDEENFFFYSEHLDTKGLLVRRVSDKAIEMCDIYEEYGETFVVTTDDEDSTISMIGDYISWVFDVEGMSRETCSLSIVSGKGLSTYDATFKSLSNPANECTESYELEYYDSQIYLVQDMDDLLFMNGILVSATSSGGDLKALYFRDDTIPAMCLMYREDVINGFRDNDITLSSEARELDGITYSIVDSAGKNFDSSDWMYDFVHISCFHRTAEDYMYAFDTVFNPLSQIFEVQSKSSSDYKLILEIPLSMVDCDAEDLGIAVDRYGFNFPNEISLAEENIDYKKTVDGNKVVFEIDFSDELICFAIVDKRPIEAVNLVVTPENVFNLEPEESPWALQNDTGDILELVDLDYLKNSIVDPNGTAVFWVSTPEELATVTYYTNNLYVREVNIDTMFYIHLLNDIDLDGYDWVPLCADPGVRGYFRGIIFGNGYSIKNLHIEDSAGSSFIGECHMTTIIGLTIDNPDLPGNNILFDGNCITEVFDTKVIVSEEHENDYILAYHFNDSIDFFDCAHYTRRADGSLEEVPLYDYPDYFYNGYDNFIYRYYHKGDGKYSYDAAKEYAAFEKDPEKFINHSYYYDDGSSTITEYQGYSLFTGWTYGGENFTNFGYVYE